MAELQKIHFHIRWSGSNELDWEPFNTIEEAEANAGNWVRPGETYTIQLSEEDCSRCAEMKGCRANV